MRERDRTNRTLTVGQLMQQLSKFDPALPVVMSQTDEPLGDYGVRGIELDEMQRENTYAEDPFGKDVYHSDAYSFRSDDYHDAPQQVVCLSAEREWQPTIDVELERPALSAGVSDTNQEKP